MGWVKKFNSLHSTKRRTQDARKNFKRKEPIFYPPGKGTLCEVSREGYLCWYAGERQKRYQIDRDRRNGVFSLDAILKELWKLMDME